MTMMIGGSDILVSIVPTHEDVMYVLGRLREVWPDAVIEGPLVALYGAPGDIDICESPEAQRRWDRDGGTDENQGTLVTVMVRATRMTLVAGGYGYILPLVREIAAELPRVAGGRHRFALEKKS